jgi:hypothetical protein
MAPSDMMLVVWSMMPSAAEPFDEHWRVNASLAGCRHEPETLRAKSRALEGGDV